MAITLGSVNTYRSNTTGQLTGVTAGSTLIFMNVGTYPVSTDTITDDTGNTWLPIPNTSAHGSTWRTQMYYTLNASAGTHNLTYSIDSGTATISLVEFKGAALSTAPFGGEISNDESFANTTSPNTTTTAITDVVVSCSLPAGDSTTAVAPTIMISPEWHGATAVGYFIPGGIGNYHTTWAAGIADTSIAVIPANNTANPALPTTSFLSFE